MASCTHFLSNQRVYERAMKRGGGRAPVSIDQLKSEDRFRLEPFHEMTPERAFVRQWALTLLDRVMARLHAEASAKGKGRLFEQVRPALLGREAAPSYTQISEVSGAEREPGQGGGPPLPHALPGVTCARRSP